MSKIFLSYRRSDSQSITDRIYDRLSLHFGPENIFKDVDSIPLGVDFRSVINAALKKSVVLLAVIGPTWLDIKDDSGMRKIDNMDDLVRIEIESGLTNSIPVIPLTIGNTAIPQKHQLPEALRDLSFRNGMPIRVDPDFNNDIARLITSISEICGVIHPSKAYNSSSSISIEFIELVKHRAMMVMMFLEEQKTAAIMHATNQQSHYQIEKKYAHALETFKKLHEKHLEALNTGQLQIAYDIVGDMYQLIYRSRYETDREPPRPCIR